MVKPVNPPGLGKPVGYAHGVQSGHMLFVSGQVGAKPGPDGKLKVVSPDFAAQFAQALDNVLAVVQAAGGRAEALLELTIYVTSLEAYRAARPALAEVWKRRLGSYYPAVTLVEVKGLFEPGSLVEIRAVAALE